MNSEYQSILNDLDSRINEARGLTALLEEPETNLSPSLRRLLSADTRSSIRASVILMLYNAVESCVNLTLDVLCETVKSKAVHPSQVSALFRKLWIDKTMVGGTETLSNNTVVSRANRLAANLLSDRYEYRLNRSWMRIAGNLDCKAVRNLCHLLGVDLDLHYRAKNGEAITLVKSGRNHLAHGEKTFSDYGREFTVGDLSGHISEVKNFLRSFVRSVSKFDEDEIFLNQGEKSV